MKEKELEKLRELFRDRLRELCERCKEKPVKDAFVKEEKALRQWYEEEYKRITAE